MTWEKTLLSGNKIVVKTGNIEEQKGDAIINWTNLDLNGGPDTWYKIHRKAGAQLRSSTFPFQQYIKRGDCFTTIAGLLDYYIVLHCVLPLPEEKHLYSSMCFHIVNTLAVYKSKNLCRNVYLSFPNLYKKELIAGLLTYEAKLPSEFSFVFMCEESDFDKTVELFSAEKKTLFKKKLYALKLFFLKRLSNFNLR